MTSPSRDHDQGPAQLAAGSAAWMRQRFARLGLGIRCAYHPGRPGVVRCWLALGAKIARSGHEPELRMQQRMLRLLLATARDEALPWFWRSVCFEYTAMPAARLRTLLALHDPPAAAALQEALDEVEALLAAVPPLRRHPRAAA